MTFVGVWLNGHPYSQGSHCEFLPKVQRQRNHHAPGVGGLAGGSESQLIGTINMFYHCTMTAVAGPDKERKMTFVDVTVRQWYSKEHGLYFMDRFSYSDHPPEFSWDSELLLATRMLIPIDSITAKVMVVEPNSQIDNQDNRDCLIGVPMWSAR